MTKPDSFFALLLTVSFQEQIYMAMELPSSSWIKSIHASCSQCQHVHSENHIHDERLTIMLPQHWWNSDETLKQLWSNSDANSQVHEECEHDGPKVTTSTHVGDTMKDDIEIYGGWWSQVKLKDHKSKNNFRRSSKYQSEATMKNQRLRANQVKRMLKTKELKRSKGYPAKDSSSSDY